MNTRRRLTGLAALAVLLGIVVGLPAVLLYGAPVDLTTIAWSTVLSRPDDGTLALAAVQVIAWAAWAFLTLSIVVEAAYALRGVRVPHLPGLSLPQSAARGLVGAAAMLFVATPISTAAAEAAAPPPTAVTTSAASAATSPDVMTAQTAPTERPAQVTTSHTVKPGESLWSIARDQLGDGHRFTEIVALNEAKLGADPGFIRPGWVLELPAPPAPQERPGHVTVQPGDSLSKLAETHLGDPLRYPEIFEASKDIPQPGGVFLSDPDVIDVGWTLQIPEPTPAPWDDHLDGDAASGSDSTQPDNDTVPAEDPSRLTTEVPPPRASIPVAPPETGSHDASPSSPDAQLQADPSAGELTTDLDVETDHWRERTAYGAGAILAAGILGLLASRRRAQQRRRAPGQPLPMPEGAAAHLEQDLRATADALSIETVDRALRTLAKACAETGEPLPRVRAARLTASQFDLYLADPSQLPAPWTGTADASVWTLQVGSPDDLTFVDVAQQPAPYPALVVVGHDDEGGHVLLDLEYLGALNIAGGDPARTKAILAALAIELATSTWADHLQVTAIGTLPELEDAMRTGRVRYLPTIDKLLEELQTRAAQDRHALAAHDTPDLQHARVTGVAADAWAPEIVLLPGDITPRQHQLLEDLVAQVPRVAVAAVTSGVDMTEWGLDLRAGHSDEHAVLWPIGLQLRPQCLPEEEYRHVLQVMALSDLDELTEPATPEPLTPVPAPPAGLQVPELVSDDAGVDGRAEPAAADGGDLLAGADATEPTPAADVDLAVDASPRILVLGPVTIEGARGPVEPGKRHRLLEYATYLALHPGAEYPAINDAIWPARKDEENHNTRNTATGKLRAWLGKDADGQDFLPRYTYTLSPAVRTDIDDWDDLIQGDPLHAPTDHLVRALALVRGRPFEGHRAKYYAWAEPIIQRMTSEIVDASYELARRRLMESRWRAAEDALVVGLSIEPAHERLWRMRILAAHESHNDAAEAEAIERLLAITEELEFELEPETESLLEALRQPGTSLDQLIAVAL